MVNSYVYQQMKNIPILLCSFSLCPMIDDDDNDNNNDSFFSCNIVNRAIRVGGSADGNQLEK